MSKIKYEDIKKEVEQIGWELISESYKNLDDEMIFKCPEGHTVYSSWKKMRARPECPTCKNNQYKELDTKVISKIKGQKRILALDQATRVSGWSIFDGNKLTKYGKFRTTGATEEERINQIRYWLISMIENWKPDEIGIEDIHFQGATATGAPVGILTYKTLAHLQGVVIDTLFDNKIPFQIISPSTWREHCKVKGKTSPDKKKSMQRKVKEQFDISVTNDEADAIGIGKYMADTLIKWEATSWE